MKNLCLFWALLLAALAPDTQALFSPFTPFVSIFGARRVPTSKKRGAQGIHVPPVNALTFRQEEVYGLRTSLVSMTTQQWHTSKSGPDQDPKSSSATNPFVEMNDLKERTQTPSPAFRPVVLLYRKQRFPESVISTLTHHWNFHFETRKTKDWRKNAACCFNLQLPND